MSAPRPERIQHRERPPAGEPAGALVLMHGRGVDENDLFPLLDALDPDRRLAGFAPRGPFTMPPGGHHWYGPVRRVGFPDQETFTASFGLLGDWLAEALAAHGLTMDRAVIGGFSQGAVMAYALAFGRGRPTPAGLVALSGFVPRVDGFDLDLEGREGVPAALGHGTFDPVIPADYGHEARKLLENAGADVLWRESPMAHSVDPEFMTQLQDWLRSIVA